MQVGSVHSLKTFVGKGAWSVGEFSTSYFSLPQQRTQRHTATHTRSKSRADTLVQHSSSELPGFSSPVGTSWTVRIAMLMYKEEKNSTRCSPGKGRWVQVPCIGTGGLSPSEHFTEKRVMSKVLVTNDRGEKKPPSW